MQNSPQAQHPNELVSPTLTLIAQAPSQVFFFFLPNEKRVQVHQYSFVLI